MNIFTSNTGDLEKIVKHVKLIIGVYQDLNKYDP